MAKGKTIQRRIKATKSIRKITQAMKLVSVAKVQTIKRKLQNISAFLAGLREIQKKTATTQLPHQRTFYFKQRRVKKILFVVITSDTGLCSGYNNLILEAVCEQRKKYLLENTVVTYLPIGKKASLFFEEKAYDYQGTYTDLLQNLTLETTEELQNDLVDGFLKKAYDKVMLVYQPHMHKKQACVKQLLPLTPMKPQKIALAPIYEPSKQKIAHYVLPRIQLLSLYEAILQSQRVEHTMRMLAMNQATDNADELIKELHLAYNHIRQDNITKGILEVISGFRG